MTNPSCTDEESGLGVKRCIVVTALVLLTACAPRNANDKRTSITGPANVLLGPTEVCVPPSMWLIVRKEQNSCVVRVVEIWTLGNATHAELEVAVRSASGWKRKVIEVSEYPLVGPHPVSFQRGNVTIPCDSFKLRYSRPSCISLYANGGREVSDRVLAAPTSWSSLDAIDLNGQHLVWYEVDDNRSKEIELADLPGNDHPN